MRKTLLVLVIIFFSFFHLAHASVVIDEFVSHPNTGEKEWVELFNDNDSPQNLSGWKLTELTSPSTNPVQVDWLSPLSGSIPAHGVLVFEVSGTNLNDSGDSIGLYDNSNNSISRVTYGTSTTVKNYSIDLIAPGIGKSGALISGVWKSDQDPTKGLINAITPPSGGAGLVAASDSPDTSPTQPASDTKSKPVVEKKIRAQITANTLGYVGLPLELKAEAFGTGGEKLSFGKYFWNFGDGDSKEVNLADSQPFTHTYFYPGEYSVSLDYYANSYAENPDASSQIAIKIIGADIIISKVGDQNDFFVELSNNTDYSADISKWVLSSDTKSFVIPRNTIIGSKKELIISARVTNFSLSDKDSLKLITPEGEVAFDYAASLIPMPVARTVLAKIPASATEIQIPATDLTSAAIQSGSEKNNSSNFYLPALASIIFIGGSAGAAYFIRRRRIPTEAGNNFEILDE